MKEALLFFFSDDMLNKIWRGNLLCNYSSDPQMSQGQGWIKVVVFCFNAPVTAAALLRFPFSDQFVAGALLASAETNLAGEACYI